MSNRIQTFGCFRNHIAIDEDVINSWLQCLMKQMQLLKLFKWLEKDNESDYALIRLRLIAERIDKQYCNPTCSEVAI